MRFFVTGGYAYTNPGDEAILKATVYRLAALHPGSHFVVWCDKKDFSVRFETGISWELCCHRCPWFFAGNRLVPRTLLFIYRLLYPFSDRFTQWAWGTKSRPVVDKMRACDAVLFVGGGYINSNYEFDLLQMHHLARLAQKSGKPVYFLGQTIGPFAGGWHRTLARTIFKDAARIVLREPYSVRDLPAGGPAPQVGTDDALDFAQSAHPEAVSSEAARRFAGFRASTGLLLGLNLRFDPSFHTRYQELVGFLNRFQAGEAKGRLKAVFIPMTTSIYKSDRQEAERFLATQGREFGLEVFQPPLTVEERLHLISGTDLFLGMRFHSLAFALSSGVPSIGLYADDYYFRKNHGLFEAYGMERFCLKTDQLERLPGLLEELLHDRQAIREHLRARQAAIIRDKLSLYHTLFPQAGS